MGKMVRLPLLMSGFLEVNFEIDSVGLSLVVNEKPIWHAKVKCVESSSSYDEWNQVSFLVYTSKKNVPPCYRLI